MPVVNSQTITVNLCTFSQNNYLRGYVGVTDNLMDQNYHCIISQMRTKNRQHKIFILPKYCQVTMPYRVHYLISQDTGQKTRLWMAN